MVNIFALRFSSDCIKCFFKQHVSNANPMEKQGECILANWKLHSKIKRSCQ